jgi:superoxide reductase
MSNVKNSIYKCAHCGLIVEVLTKGAEPSCCGEKMALLNENSVDAATEKHVPLVQKINGGYKVTVGSVAHPMSDDHLIEWIELISSDKTLRKTLAPGDSPEAIFKIDDENVWARAYCNLHGLWKSN